MKIRNEDEIHIGICGCGAGGGYGDQRLICPMDKL